MENKKIIKESKIIIINLLLAVITIVASIYLIVILGRDLNRFLFVEESSEETGIMNFDFAKYEELGL